MSLFVVDGAEHVDAGVAAGGPQAAAGEGGHACAGLNCGHREPEGGQRTRGLARATAHLQQGR